MWRSMHRCGSMRAGLHSRISISNAFRQYATQPAGGGEQSIELYYNRLSLPSGMLYKFIPGIIVSPEYSHLKNDLQKAIGKENGTVTDITPRPAEGGAFVTVKTANKDEVKRTALKGFERRWLFFNHHSCGHEVLGKPWITDIPRSISKIIEVEPKLPDEDCYELLRPYGRIKQIKDGKVVFYSVQDAITASYCSHRITPPIAKGTPIRLLILPRESIWSRVKSWLAGHTRLVIPAVIALSFAIAYAVFEPIREFSVSTKVKGTFSSVSKYVEWARDSGQRLFEQKLTVFGSNQNNEGEKLELNKLLTSVESTEDSNNDSKELLNNASRLRTYVEEGAPTFTVVVGPKGSGKTETLDIALGSDKLVLDIDCDQLRGVSDERMLRNLAHSIGYWPLFSWTNNVFKAAEVGVQGITGQTTSIAETTDQQVRRLLGTATRAIQKVALRNSSKHEKPSAYLETHPDQLPVIVLRSYSGSDHLGELLAEWAGELTRLQVGRVVFVTEDAYSFDKTLSTALPNRVFKIIRVEDASPRAAKEHVLELFAELATTPDAKRAISEFAELSPDFLKPLGGRFTDLQSFGKRLLNGESPEAALNSLIHAAALEVSQLFLSELSSKNWSVDQSWTLVSMLAQGTNSDAWLSIPGTLTTNPVISSTDIAALGALESSGLITLRTVGGHITGVKPSRPLFRSAFRELTSDPLVSNIMGARIAKVCMKSATAKINDAETELAKLATLSNSREVKERQEYVAKQLGEAQSKLVGYQEQYNAAINVLKKFKWYQPNESSFAYGGGSPSTGNSSVLKWFESEDTLRSNFD